MHIILFIVAIILAVFLFFLLLGIIRTWHMQHGENQRKFLKGKVPSNLPDGFYKGWVRGYAGPWMGKSFNKEKGTGMNVFIVGKNHIERFPFVTSVEKGLQDKNLDVIKINYNLTQNSFFLRMILDEIVEVEQDTYLGKVHIILFSLIPFTVGYFSLKKE
jgi:hypothetical protein